MRAAALLMLIGLAAGCGNPDPSDITMLDLPGTPLAEGGREYAAVAWVSADRLLVQYEPDSANATGDLWTLDVPDGDLAVLPVEADPACRSRTLWLPRLLPDGRLGAAQGCVESGPPTRERRFLAAIDLATGGVERLVEIDSLIQGYSFRPGLKEGTVSLGNRVCQGLAAIDEGSVKAIDLRIEDGGKGFNLADQLPAGREDCSDTGLADQPAWDSTGSRLTFLASPAAVGLQGTDRLDAPWNVYLLESSNAVRPILKGIKHPNTVAWSPDDRWIAFGGQLVGHGEGTWAIEPATGRIVRLSAVRADWLAWSPTGDSLAVVTNSDPTSTPLTRDVLRIDLGAALSPG